MNNNQILLLSSLTVFVSYVAYVWIKYGVQKSISESYYVMKNKALFTLFCWGFTIPLMIASPSFLMFIAISAICFVGAASAFKDDTLTEKVHVFGAITGVVFSQLAIIFDLKLIIVSAITIIAALAIRFGLFKNIKNTTWWAEIIVFSSIIVALAIKLF